MIASRVGIIQRLRRSMERIPRQIARAHSTRARAWKKEGQAEAWKRFQVERAASVDSGSGAVSICTR